jgi:hypothetical protein
LKASREKCQITYEGKPIRIIADFSTEIFKARRAWNELFRALEEKKKTLKFLDYSTQQSFHT